MTREREDDGRARQVRLGGTEEQANWKTGMELSRCESEPSADSTKSPFEWYLWSQSLGVGTRW